MFGMDAPDTVRIVIGFCVSISTKKLKYGLYYVEYRGGGVVLRAGTVPIPTVYMFDVSAQKYCSHRPVEHSVTKMQRLVDLCPFCSAETQDTQQNC